MARRIIAMLFALSILPATVVALPSEPTLIPVVLADFKFVPSTVRLQPHTTYVLRLTNSGASEHDLAAPKFFMAATVSADSIKKVRDGRVVLHAGETVDIELTTGDVGSFSMRCTFFGHALMGMTGHLEVAGPSRTNSHTAANQDAWVGRSSQHRGCFCCNTDTLCHTVRKPDIGRTKAPITMFGRPRRG